MSLAPGMWYLLRECHKLLGGCHKWLGGCGISYEDVVLAGRMSPIIGKMWN